MHSSPQLLLSRVILQKMRSIEGWLEEDEADLLLGAALYATSSLPSPHNIVEVGSYCGRSTVVLGSVARSMDNNARVYAVDPHDGKVGSLDRGISQTQPTLLKFKQNMQDSELSDLITIIEKCSFEVQWNEPISLLFIDGLHDYSNVSRDFIHFEQWIVPGGLIAFHDYAYYYPGVHAFVNEVLLKPSYNMVQRANSMVVLQKVENS